MIGYKDLIYRMCIIYNYPNIDEFDRNYNGLRQSNSFGTVYKLIDHEDEYEKQ